MSIQDMQMDLERFTYTELAFMSSAVKRYFPIEGAEDIKRSILSKIDAECSRRKNLETCRLSGVRIGDADNGSLVVLSEPDYDAIPIVKFSQCPNSVDFARILRTYYPPRQRLVTWEQQSFSYYSRDNRVSIKDTYEPGYTVSEPPMNITLTSAEMELLIAFYMYHSLEERGGLRNVEISEETAEGKAGQ